MPSTSEKQRRFFGAELGRKRHGESTPMIMDDLQKHAGDNVTFGVSEKQMAEFAKKPVEPKHGRGMHKDEKHHGGRMKHPRGGLR